MDDPDALLREAADLLENYLDILGEKPFAGWNTETEYQIRVLLRKIAQRNDSRAPKTGSGSS